MGYPTNFIGQRIWHRFAMPAFVRAVPGVSVLPQPPANGWQPSGLHTIALFAQIDAQVPACQLET